MAWSVARMHGLDPHLVLAVVKVESSWRSNAVSKKGALGLMQVMPFWRELLPEAFKLYTVEDLLDPEKNLHAGCYVLARYIESSSSLSEALQKYSGGKKGYSADVLTERRRQNDGNKRPEWRRHQN